MVHTVQDLIINPFLTRNYDEKVKILQEGRPCPDLPKLLSQHRDKRSSYTRHFYTNHYKSVEWIAGCEFRSKLFCWPCLLFCREVGVWNSQGFCDLNHLATAQQKHEGSQMHIQAFVILKMFEKQVKGSSRQLERKIEIETTNKHNKQVTKNINLLKRVIDVICFLAKQELPFRSDDERNSSADDGNYFEMLKLLQDYDPILKSHLKNSTLFQDTSYVVQNDIIIALEEKVKDQIKKEVDKATFVAIIFDETSHVTPKSKFSTVLRFINEGKIYERFIGFTDISGKKGFDRLFNSIVKIVEEFRISNKLVAQSYDGLIVPLDHIKRLRNRVLELYPLALFTYCHSRVLNFVLQQALTNIKLCHVFFHTLNGLCMYFLKVSERVNVLNDFFLKKLSCETPVKWNFTSCYTLKKYRVHLIEFFKNIIDNYETWDTDTIVGARGFLNFLEEFSTILLLEIFSKLFSFTDLLYRDIQSKACDVVYCHQKVFEAADDLQKYKRSDFEEVWYTALSVEHDSLEPESDQSYPQVSKRPKFSSVNEVRENTYRELYYKIVDCICEQIVERYSSLPKLEFFHLLCHKKYDQYKKKFPDDLLTKLKEVYGLFIDTSRLKNELIVIYSTYDFSNKHVHELMEFVIENQLLSIFKEVYKLAKLILTLPCIAAPAEYSFSSLKRVNTLYRSNPSKERFCGPSILSIEKKLLTELMKQGDLFYDDILKRLTFNRKRRDLIYIENR